MAKTIIPQLIPEDGKTTIFAKYITESKNAYYLDCEGDKVWMPKSQVSLDRNAGKVTIPDWLFEKNFPNG